MHAAASGLTPLALAKVFGKHRRGALLQRSTQPLPAARKLKHAGAAASPADACAAAAAGAHDAAAGSFLR